MEKYVWKSRGILVGGHEFRNCCMQVLFKAWKTKDHPQKPKSKVRQTEGQKKGRSQEGVVRNQTTTMLEGRGGSKCAKRNCSTNRQRAVLPATQSQNSRDLESIVHHNHLFHIQDTLGKAMTRLRSQDTGTKCLVSNCLNHLVGLILPVGVKKFCLAGRS